jgi:hypothetical protein
MGNIQGRIFEEIKEEDQMNKDMKKLMNEGENKGYRVVKYDEYTFKDDENMKLRYLIVFEEE